MTIWKHKASDDPMKDNTYSRLAKDAQHISRRSAAADYSQMLGALALVVMVFSILLTTTATHKVGAELEYGLCANPQIAPPALARTQKCQDVAKSAAKGSVVMLNQFAQQVADRLDVKACNRQRALLIAVGFQLGPCPEMKLIKAPPPQVVVTHEVIRVPLVIRPTITCSRMGSNVTCH